MRLRTFVWREVFERKNQLATSFVAILLGISVIVGVKNITFYSEKAVAAELDALGANILILPKSASLQDYYSADMQGEEFPEEYVTRLTTSDLQGLDNLSPKLSLPVESGGNRFTLTGILPTKEFQAKAAWQGAGIFALPENCGTVNVPGASTEPPKETLVRKRVITTLEEDQALVGSDIGAALKVKEGDTLTLLGKSFAVTAVLPATGTVDDSRVFAHLHTVQQLAGKGPVLNAIEIVGCCNQISKGLVQKINTLLPDAKVVTITQIVDTQIRTNQMMARLSLLFLAIIVLVGGASIANYMYSNVFERRKEIGTLMALGAGSRVVLKMFLMKALLLGLAGGIAGYVLGTAVAVVFGPRIAGVIVLPMPSLALWALGVAVAISLMASYFPARQAARLDPATALQEM
ncbi:MAG TPA: FtsX-like permease family protein [Candidatus Hydrogenedentes bacterium]|nr:FtsX-like permease family protein [Candidatus Hydrogenedentota bacterium]